MFLVIVVRSIIGAIIGWIIGMTLTRVMFAIENRRLKRKMIQFVRPSRKIQTNL